MNRLLGILLLTGAAAANAADAVASGNDTASDRHAARIEAAMTDDERFALLSGIMPIPLPGLAVDIPPGVPPTAGYHRGSARLGVPDLLATDASLGVTNPFQARPGDGATALPASLALAAAFDPALARRAGAMIADEARSRGFNVLLAPGVNLARDPRNGRNFEYLGEDPWLGGVLAGAAIRGIQSRQVVAVLKHFALNAQETQRDLADAVIDEAALRESELLAFQLAIEQGDPGSVMCAYNLVNGVESCGSDFLLNQVLKREWGFRGWVMSDWGAVDSADYFMRGLDQQSGRQMDRAPWFDGPLREQVASGIVPRARVSEAVRRILRSLHAVGVQRRDLASTTNAPVVDAAAHAAVALDVARAGIVLLQNDGVLPLRDAPQRVLVVGGHATQGVLSGGGSSQVTPANGAPFFVDLGGDSPLASMQRHLYMPSAPFAALKRALPQAKLSFDSGYAAAATAARAAQADLVIVFANRWEGEFQDAGSMELPQGQDALIARIAAANPNTVVVLQTGNPIALPWLGQVRAVLQAWYPGQEGGQAIADVLTGRVNPSGHLPLSWPASIEQTPRGPIAGLGLPPRTPVRIEYTEGSEAGYRWFARQGTQPLFAFGHGLSYTRFEHAGLRVTRGRVPQASLSVRNSGDRAGADVVQLYLVSRAGQRLQRLVGFARVELAAGEQRDLQLRIDPRLLADWAGDGWLLPAGRYRFALGASAAQLSATFELDLAQRRIQPRERFQTQ